MSSELIPQDIQALIQIAEEERDQERVAAEYKQAAEKKDILEKYAKEIKELLEKVQHLIPDVLFPYLELEDINPSDYEVAWYERVLEFNVPGLAPIAMVFNIDKEDEATFESWMLAGVDTFEWDSETDLYKKAGFSFRHGRYERQKADKTNIRQVLWAAKDCAREKEERQIQLDKDTIRYLKKQERQQQEKSLQVAEEEALFNALIKDPVAIHMLKAFVLLRDERSMFEQRIEEMDGEMMSMEDRWSRKASDLRRQADEAERRARDEQSRLQNDLDDAESKLKKVQRGY